RCGTAGPHLGGLRCSSGLGAPPSSTRRLRTPLPPITDKLTSVLAFHGRHAFALGTAMTNWPTPGPHRRCRTAQNDYGPGWPCASRLVATAAENRLRGGCLNVASEPLHSTTSCREEL